MSRHLYRDHVVNDEVRLDEGELPSCEVDRISSGRTTGAALVGIIVGHFSPPLGGLQQLPLQGGGPGGGGGGGPSPAPWQSKLVTPGSGITCCPSLLTVE